MKNILYITFLVLSVACSTKNNKSQYQQYAEISIADGGYWDNNVYVDGQVFNNVQQLKVPSQHTDHSYFIRYEGPGWESDKVGYRLYLDWRNAIDIFGKKTNQLVLKEVGQDGFDSYHEMQSWGMDVLKVGNSLGLGSFGRYDGSEVHHFKNVDSTLVSISNELESSSINISYHGWTTNKIVTDLAADISIESGSRLTHVTLDRSTLFEGLCTGIVKHDVAVISSDSIDSAWSYIATFGIQSLVPDELGMVLFYRNDQVASLVDGNDDHLVVFKKNVQVVDYYFAASWVQEPEGIGSKEAFVTYINEVLTDLNTNDAG